MTTTDNLELELVSGTETFDTDKVMNNFSKIDTAVGNLQDGVGNVESLTTTAKTDLVAAINEVDGNIGDLSGLSTTAKENLVSAVNELNQKIPMTMDWDSITGKPSTYPPSTHNHDNSYYTKNQIDIRLDSKYFKIISANLQFSNGFATWSENLSGYGQTLYFASICGLGVNDVFACSITNGTASSASLRVENIKDSSFNVNANVRILVVVG